MAKMHFKYASMNSGKSIDLIRTAYNYEENGYKVFIIKPGIDTKAGNKISSRVGLERNTDLVLNSNDSLIDKLYNKINDINCILVDEAQFLAKDQVDELFIVSKSCNIPVICYGLRTDFTMNSFEGSKRLLEICDELEEIPTLCKCGEIARYVGRKVNGEYVLKGDTVVIDGTSNVEYVPLCGYCYLKKVKNINFDLFNRRCNYKKYK
ncbi:MAG: thymidine kinase [bacterium]|nr:thymidine kinase [bacterium]